MSALASAAPASTWAWRHVAARPAYQKGGNLNAAGVLVALAWISDEDLNGPRGLTAVPAHRIARLTGLATSTVEKTLRGLAGEGTIVRMAHNAGAVVAESGDSIFDARRGRFSIIGYRVPEEAYS